MSVPALTGSTGIQSIDRTLQTIVRIFEDTFPDRIRAYYLLGSHVEHSAVPLSDIDCFVIFADQFSSPQEEAAAETVGQQCATVSPVRLDIGAYPENALEHLHPVLRVSLKLGSTLLFGIDIRQVMQLPHFPDYTDSVIAGAQNFIARLRGETTLITRQVSYPDASDEFFGYTAKRIAAWYPSTIAAGTKELVATVSRIATARVVQQTNRYVSGKQQAIQLFKQEIGGLWAPFVDRIFQRCKLEWKYLVPEAERERLELRELCRHMLAFENEFLHACQEPDAA